MYRAGGSIESIAKNLEKIAEKRTYFLRVGHIIGQFFVDFRGQLTPDLVGAFARNFLFILFCAFISSFFSSLGGPGAPVSWR